MADSPSRPATGDAPVVRIHYRRPPDREQVFVQTLVHRTDRAVVTYLERMPLPRPILVDGVTVLDDGAPAVWFTFPDEWHDVGRFHLADGTFTGVYANVLTPVRCRDPRTWETTDLFLDVWLPPDGTPRILDRDELDEAVRKEWIDEPTAERARDEADRLATAAERGEWPPAIVDEWTLGRVRRSLRGRR